MIKNQVKNIIKLVVLTIVATLIGEGVLGAALYWPFLLVLLPWSGIYWLALGVGILVSVFNGLMIGLPSLLILLILGIYTLIFGDRQDSLPLQLSMTVVASIVTDKLLGIHLSWGEVVILIVVGVLVLRGGDVGDSIRLKY